MNYRLKRNDWSGSHNHAKEWARITVMVFLVFVSNLAFAEATATADRSIREGAAIESQGVESQPESELKTNPVASDYKKRLVTSSDSKVASSPGVNSADWLKAILGLMAVVALIFAIAWFVKRFTGLAVSNQQQMRIVSAIPVGTKERIALIEVADKQLLVGITQHNINLLHSFEEPVVNKNDKTAVDFSSRLQAILSKGTSD